MPRNDLADLGRHFKLSPGRDVIEQNKRLRKKNQLAKQLEFTGEETVLEYRIKRYVKERLNAIGAYHFWPVQTGMGVATLDCLGCYRGRFFGIETKKPGGKPTARQEITMQQMRAAGAEVFVIDSEKAAKELFIEIV